MKLGIVYKDNKIINHRSLLKIFLNPFLRYVGFYIGTVLESEELKGIKIQRCKRSKFKWSFKYDVEFDRIVKKRIII